MKHLLTLGYALAFSACVLAQPANPEGLPIVPLKRDGQIAQEAPTNSAMQAIATDDDSKKLLALLKKKLPGTTFTEVSRSQLDGIFMVRMGRNIAYADATGRHFLFGHLYDMDTRQDLTAQALQAAPVVAWKDLPLEKAIRLGSGELKLAVFSDPDCPFCRQVEIELAKMKNVEIYVFMYPIEGLHKGATRTSQSIWCAPNRGTAWREYMLAGKKPVLRNCSNPVAETVALAERMGLNSTPTLISGDGRVVSGAATAVEITQWLRGEAIGAEEKQGAAR